MAKISIKNLAQTLYELTSNKKKDEVAPVLKEFVAFLAKKRLMGKAPQIIEQYRKIYNRESGVVDAEVFSRFPLDEKKLSMIEKSLSRKFPKQDINLQPSLDKKMLGGVKIKVEDLVIDRSLDSQIAQLQTYLINKI